eukprot:4185006-Pyramimonas_sp.AAC.1
MHTNLVVGGTISRQEADVCHGPSGPAKAGRDDRESGAADPGLPCGGTRSIRRPQEGARPQGPKVERFASQAVAGVRAGARPAAPVQAEGPQEGVRR